MRARVAVVITALLVGGVSGFHARQPLAGVDGNSLFGRLAGLLHVHMQVLDVVAHVAEDLADPILELQADQHLGEFIADAEALALQHVGRVGQAAGDALEALQHLLDALLGGTDRMAVLVRAAGRGMHQLGDGVVDDVDLGRHLLAGLAGFARETAHGVGHHGKPTPGLAGTGGFDGGVEGQQVGLCGNRRDIGGHGPQLAGIGGQVAHLGQGFIAAGLGGLQGIDDLDQFTFALGQHLYGTATAAAGQLTGGQLRGLHGLFQARGNAGEAAGQRDDCGFGLLPGAFDLLGPDRHRTENDFVELLAGFMGQVLAGLQVVAGHGGGDGAVELLTLRTRTPYASTDANGQEGNSQDDVLNTWTVEQYDANGSNKSDEHCVPEDARWLGEGMTVWVRRHGSVLEQSF
ncbi:Thiolase_C domain-containing protein [Pseudomonas brassicacearum]